MSKITNSIVLTETDREAYECVVRLMDTIVEITEQAGNEAVGEMIIEQMYDTIFECGPEELYNMYRFFLRMLFRVKVHPEQREFNTISFDDNVIRITNYDYKTYKWLHDKHYCDGLSNDIAELERVKLPEPVAEYLISLAKNKEE